jgi:outer membrane murein-binding lipoprotein Lpp
VPKIVADMYISPAVRRWTARFGLAVVIAIAIGYLPGQVMSRDPRAGKIEAQLAQLAAEAQTVAAQNAVLRQDIAALRSDIGAIEERARADLGMAYPDEVVLRLPAPDAPEAAP